MYSLTSLHVAVRLPPCSQGQVVEVADVKITNMFKGSSPGTQMVALTSGDFVVALDKTEDEALTEQWLLREMTNRVQKLRKKAGVRLGDPVEAYYDLPAADPLAAGSHTYFHAFMTTVVVLSKHRAQLEKTLKISVVPAAKPLSFVTTLGSEAVTINKVNFNV
jgi:hypothetical protein